MNIEGLDYNTQREKIRLNQYGREIQKMVDYCVALPTKEERQECAETIIATMRRMTPSTQNNADRMQTLWDHLALMSNNPIPMAATLMIFKSKPPAQQFARDLTLKNIWKRTARKDMPTSPNK